jgi:hypothetical protein
MGPTWDGHLFSTRVEGKRVGFRPKKHRSARGLKESSTGILSPVKPGTKKVLKKMAPNFPQVVMKKNGLRTEILSRSGIAVSTLW